MDYGHLYQKQFVRFSKGLATACKLIAIALILIASAGFNNHAEAKGKRVYFNHSSSSSIKKYTNHKRTIKRRSALRHHRGVRSHRQYVNRRNFRQEHNQGHKFFPRGPLVINVGEALKHRRSKRIKIIHHQRPNNLQRHVLSSNGGVERVVYYDARQCDAGYDCVVRLGKKASSPKIIVVGEKRKPITGSPIVIYPPL